MEESEISEVVAPEIQRERVEKKLIREFFDNKEFGFFVEVGANEPKTDYSQSWHLESQLGWKGVLVEPNPELAQKARMERPHAMVFEVACVSDNNQDSIQLFIPVINGSEITGHASIGKNIDDFSYTAHREVIVKAQTLNAVLEEAKVNSIDFLSIDVEGAEMEVLKGLDLQRYRPRLIMLEDKHVYLDKHRYLTRRGYRLVKRTTLNCWYIPVGTKRPHQSFFEKLRLWKRMYLSIWPKKIARAYKSKSIEPFKKL